MSLLDPAPASMDAVVGVASRLYVAGILNTLTPGAYSVAFVGPGSADADRWIWTPAPGDVGASSLTINVSLGAALLESVQIPITVRADTAPGRPRIELVGDSLTALSLYPDALAALLNASGKLGWTMLGSIAGTGAGVFFEAISGWTWTLFATQGPFAPTGTLDIPGYTQSALGSRAPDLVVVRLGTNDLTPAVDPSPPYGPVNAEAVMDAILLKAELLLSAMRAAWPKTPIGVGLVPAPNPDPDAWPASFPLATWLPLRARLVARQKLQWGNRRSEGLFLIATSAAVAAAQFTDNVHPDAAGAAQEAEMVYGFVRSQIMPRASIPSAQNTFVRSEDFGNATWSKFNCTVSSAVAASVATPPPSSGVAGGAVPTAVDAMVEGADASPVQHALFLVTPAQVLGRVWCASVIAKAGARSWLRFIVSGAVQCWFNLATGVVGSVVEGVAGSFLARYIESILLPSGAASGWYRCSVVYVGVGTVQLNIEAQTADLATTYQGAAGTNAIFLTAAQLCQANWPGPYVKTIAAPADTGAIRNLRANT